MKVGNVGAAATRVIRRGWCDVVWTVQPCRLASQSQCQAWDAESRSGQPGQTRRHQKSTVELHCDSAGGLFEVVLSSFLRSCFCLWCFDADS